MTNTESREFITYSICRCLIPPERPSILEWAKEVVRLPSDTGEPGFYDPDRAPYQKEILKAASPDDPTREMVLVFGAQMGKTLIEMIVMMYYIHAYPRPQAFVFSDDGELKAFVKMKFDPLLASNKAIEGVIGKGLARKGHTLNELQYPGGFLRFVAGNVEKNFRSYSIAVGIMDELDTYPTNVGGNGSPIVQFEKRFSIYDNTRKFLVSSTPANNQSLILDRLTGTTYEKYFVPCPHCKKLITLEWEYLKWETNESKQTVTSVWLECPECKEKIYNSDKTFMLATENGARWIRTNEGAPSDRRGFFLNALYAPVGWRSWEKLAQTYVTAMNSKTELRVANITAFYNTDLCRQYKESDIAPPLAEEIEQYASLSNFKRGTIPNWVLIITTGTDVQKNRLETTIMGWGKRGRNIVIDHIVFDLMPNEEMEDLQNSVWQLYISEILEGVWKREDGCIIQNLGNAIDRSFLSMTIDTFYITQSNPHLYPVRGIDGSLKNNSLIPESKRGNPPEARYWATPVDDIKKEVYSALKRSIIAKKNDEDPYGMCEFPCDLPTEFFLQLTAEQYVYDSKKKKNLWQKTRARNETLDTRVYNYAIAHLIGITAWKDDYCDELQMQYKKQLQIKENLVNGRPRKRILSKGLT